MKSFILFIILICFISCEKIERRGPFVSKSKIIYKHHEDAKTKWGYHYGYSVMKGKYCYHYGSETVPEKYIVHYLFMEDTIKNGSKELFSYDSILIYYSKIFKVEEKKSLLKIKSIA